MSNNGVLIFQCVLMAGFLGLVLTESIFGIILGQIVMLIFALLIIDGRKQKESKHG